MSKIKPTKVHWNEIEKVGMPPAELTNTTIGPNTTERTFLLRGEYSIFTGYAFKDGSGFDTDINISDTPIAWAIIEGF